MKSIFSALLIIATTGCASITQGTTQGIKVHSDRECTATRGEFKADIKPPMQQITLKKSAQPLVFECAGTEPKKIESKATAAAMAGAVFLDFGVVDMMTGAFWAYPETVNLWGDSDE